MSVPGDDGPSSDESREGRRDGGPLPTDEDASIGDWIHAFRTADSGWPMIAREIVTSAGAVLLVGLLLFAVSGVWPPMVAIESGSMEPQMYKGDLVFIIEEHRFSPDRTYASTGVVTSDLGQRTGYHSFNEPGDVIVYQSYGEPGTPIIHRARFWVNESENWYEKADQRYVHSSNCRELPNCPAPHAGFITKGDNNDYYDQVSGISDPVKPSWITGKAKFRIPWLGWVRLQFANLLAATGPEEAITRPDEGMAKPSESAAGPVHHDFANTHRSAHLVGTDSSPGVHPVGSPSVSSPSAASPSVGSSSVDGPPVSGASTA